MILSELWACRLLELHIQWQWWRFDLFFLEQAMEETQGVDKQEDTSELHQLQQHQQQASETIAQLLEQRKPMFLLQS